MNAVSGAVKIYYIRQSVSRVAATVRRASELNSLRHRLALMCVGSLVGTAPGRCNGPEIMRVR
jgi:hypothetical protein